MAGSRSGMTVADWMLTILLVSIPGVGIIMTIIWACGVGKNSTRVNFCRALLIWLLVIVVMYLVAFGGVFSGITSGISRIFN